MCRQLWFLALTIWVVNLIGCATYPKYEATVRLPNAGAEVSGSIHPFPSSLSAKLQQIDGQSVGFWQRQYITPVLIDPGMRTLTVQGEYVGFPFSGYANVELKADLQAGHAYKIQVERKKRLLTFWVEDQATHEAVSDRQTVDANVYIPAAPVFVF